MTRLVIIGIDSMDKDLVTRYADVMPNLSRISASGLSVPTVSTIPPDSVTAWATIYTGMNPAEHGMVSFADPLEKVSEIVLKEVDNRALVGNTFWDDASRRGKRVCVICPNVGYPPWKVNGIMIGRASSTTAVECMPSELDDRLDLAGLNQVRGLPKHGERNLSKAIATARDQICKEFAVTEKLLAREKWDLFFAYSSVLDWVQHIFWSHMDNQKSGKPRDERFKDTIRDFYRLYDCMIGRIFEKIDSDQVVIVLSDHGHGRRPVRLFNFNVTLNRSEMLHYRTASNRDSAMIGRLSCMMKTNVQRIVNKWNLGRPAAAVLKAYPRLRRPFMRAGNVDWQRTLAFVSDQSGLKAYSHGGVILRKDLIESEGLKYEDLRNRIIHMLESSVDESNGRHIVKWAVKREKLYSGQYTGKYPDIVAVLDEEYGFGWAASGPVVSPSATYNIMPGSHKADTPLLIVSVKSPCFGVYNESSPYRLEQFRKSVECVMCE